jgi:hypothetical protein
MWVKWVGWVGWVRCGLECSGESDGISVVASQMVAGLTLRI